jgi:hypothetical protein
LGAKAGAVIGEYRVRHFDQAAGWPLGEGGADPVSVGDESAFSPLSEPMLLAFTLARNPSPVLSAWAAGITAKAAAKATPHSAARVPCSGFGCSHSPNLSCHSGRGDTTGATVPPPASRRATNATTRT